MADLNKAKYEVAVAAAATGPGHPPAWWMSNEHVQAGLYDNNNAKDFDGLVKRKSRLTDKRLLDDSAAVSSVWGGLSKGGPMLQSMGLLRQHGAALLAELWLSVWLLENGQ